MTEFNSKAQVEKRLESDDSIVVTDTTADEHVEAVLVQQSFDSIQHISRVLDDYDLEVDDEMWVDEGRKFFVKPRS